MDTPARQITSRYQLIAPIGAGSMGVVLRVADRLTGQEVALKQVLLTPDLTPSEADEELRLLTNEFQVLAGLRHPHIISVLDYGIDASRQPFYTMEVLERAQSILEACLGLSLESRVRLLLEALEALAYLHRRGILHHDLKPENILVADRHVRLLDFGLAVLSSQQRSDDSFGTLQYLAPEVLQRRAYTEAADLYSLGVIAYELLIGRYPFDAQTARSLMEQVRTALPDLTALADVPALAAVVGQLLAKDPRERPASAQATIAALSEAMGWANVRTDASIRESYLQAATFVGREAELAQLFSALGQAKAGRGSAWLIGGESGVGKSRLLDELRIRALVDGFLVLRGQGAQEVGLPYVLWREPLRHLVALAESLDDLTASVLLPLLPDLETLLGRPVVPAPVLKPQEAQTRLLTTIAQLFWKHPQPILLLLEDLHWTDEGQQPLLALARLVAEHRLLIIGSYRDDEAPALPTQFPTMRLLHLARFTTADMVQLSTAMLGAVGAQPEIVALLQRETEGNAFFAVEVVRALATQVGNLEQIGQMALPETVLPHGVQSVVARRLARVPEAAQPLLRCAAFIGRSIELPLLRLLADGIEVDRWWLPLSAEAALIDLQGGQWQFQHDKIRDELLRQIAPEQRPGLHRRVAEAIELCYPAEPDHAARLAFQWRMAGDATKELAAVTLAAQHAATHDALREARSYYVRMLELLGTADHAARYPTLVQLFKTLDFLGDRAAQEALIPQLHAHAAALGDPAHEVEILTLEAQLADQQGQLDQAEALFAEADQQAELIGAVRQQAQILVSWASALIRRRKLEPARTRALQSATLADSLGTPSAEAYRVLSLSLFSLGEVRTARDNLRHSLTLYRQAGDRAGLSMALGNLGMVCDTLGEHNDAAACYREGLAIARSIGLLQAELILIENQGYFKLLVGDYQTGIALTQQAVSLSQQINDQVMVSFALNNLGFGFYKIGNYDQAMVPL